MPKENGAPAIILDWLASLKLTLFVFFALAAASVIGTLLPQGTSPAEVQSHFSPMMAAIIENLGLNNLYHSTWFRVLLLLLCANLLVCTLDRLPKTIRLIQKKEEPFDSEKLLKFSNSAAIPTKVPLSEALPILKNTLAQTFGHLREIQTEGSFCAVIEKGRWSRLMVYGVHISVLIVLLGALSGSILGFKGFMNISEGSASHEVVLTDDKGIALPFEVKCDKFDVSFYDNGAPKDYRSDLSIIEGGKEVLKESIRVNDPLTYNGITFYQASYGTMLKQAEIEVTDRDSGKSVTMTLPFRSVRTIPGTQDQVQIAEYQENLMRFGPALGIMLGKAGQEATSASWILANRPDFHGNKIKNYHFRVVHSDSTYYTGLQVKRDPGVWLVWAGFSFMIIGIGLTFYSSHNKLWVYAGPDKKGKKTIITVAGRSSRNAPGFSDKFDELTRLLTDRLKPEDK